MGSRVDTGELVVNAARSRTWIVTELGIAYALLEGALWSRGEVQFTFAMLTLAWVGFCTARSSRGAAELGIGTTGFLRSLWIVPVAVLLAAGMMLSGWLAGTMHPLFGLNQPLFHAGMYAVWALVQEYLTMSFIFVRIEELLGSRRAILMTAALFCVAHIPNGTLMAATLAMSVFFCWFFERFRNIYPLAIAHALLGLSLSLTLSTSITHRMHVGIAYFS
jgi:Type II CAAX prenyl endopeptidase Rce1-like